MATGQHRDLWRYLRNGASVLGIVLATLTVQRLLTPLLVTAQSTGPQEVRASAFVLVGADGTVRARLGPSIDPNSPNGVNLSLFDHTGQNLLFQIGTGNDQSPGMTVFAPDGTRRIGLGAGTPPQIGPGISVFAADGTTRRISMGIANSTDHPGFTVLDENGTTLRASMGELPDGSFAVRVRENNGSLLASLP